LREVALALPTTQAFDAMRRIMQGELAPAGLLARAGAMALVAVMVAWWFFGRVVRDARRSGRLMRLD
jgi:hypothetical protein